MLAPTIRMGKVKQRKSNTPARVERRIARRLLSRDRTALSGGLRACDSGSERRSGAVAFMIEPGLQGSVQIARELSCRGIESVPVGQARGPVESLEISFHALDRNGRMSLG